MNNITKETVMKQRTKVKEVKLLYTQGKATYPELKREANLYIRLVRTRCKQINMKAPRLSAPGVIRSS